MNPRIDDAMTRPAAVAGMFYPADALELLEEVDTLLGTARLAAFDVASIKAIAVPHAGYIYSGATAAAAYGLLENRRSTIRRVVLLGPTHRVAIRGIALPDAELFETPLGSVPIDIDLAVRIEALPQVVGSRDAHAAEHSLEVQLPFLQRVIGEFSLLPLAVGMAHADEVAEVLDAVWGGPETLIVVSTDLSHFHPYREAQELDGATVADVLAMRSDIDHEHACGATPLNGLLVSARRRGLTPHLVDARNSGDTAGDRSRVVGYASFALCEARRDG
jgi:AmmeMemoRadiSam system protein B